MLTMLLSGGIVLLSHYLIKPWGADRSAPSLFIKLWSNTIFPSFHHVHLCVLPFLCLLISCLLQRCLPPLPLHRSLLAFHHSLHPSLLSGWINMQTALLSSAVEASCLGVLSAPMELSLVCGWISLSCPKHFSNAFPFSLLGGKCDSCITRFVLMKKVK